MRISDPDRERLRSLFVELEFHTLAKDIAAPATEAPVERPLTTYVTVDSVAMLNKAIARARKAPHIALDTEAVIDPSSPTEMDPLRATLVGMAIAVGPGEAYYLSFGHREWEDPQGMLALGDVTGELGAEEKRNDGEGDEEPRKKARKRAPTKAEPTSIAARALASGVRQRIRNLPPISDPAMAPLRALLEDPTVSKTVQNAKFDVLVLRGAGIELRGLDFDTMVASYVLDPGRRSHGLDLLAPEFLGRKMTTFEGLCGRGKELVPDDQVPG